MPAQATLAGNAVRENKAITNFPQMLARPIFFKSREPFVPPPPIPSPARPSTPPAIAPPVVVADPGLMLGGVMMIQGKRKAYLLKKNDPVGAWVVMGDELAGWKIQVLDAAGVQLQNGSRKVELKLYSD